MHVITLDSETDFKNWRKAARTLVLNNVSPSGVTWTVRGNAPELFEPATDRPLEPPHGTFNVSIKFVELAKSAILHRDHERFAILYRSVGGSIPPIGTININNLARSVAISKIAVSALCPC